MLLQTEHVCATLRDENSLLIYPCSEKVIESFGNFSSGNISAIWHQTFKAGSLPSTEREIISLALSILSTEARHFGARNTFPNEIHKSGVDSLGDEVMRRTCYIFGTLLLFSFAVFGEQKSYSTSSEQLLIDMPLYEFELRKRWGYYGSATDQPNTLKPWGGYGPYWNWDFRG
ncbi:hypothetical protein Tcan_04363 [Toxocara canis]|uniref:Uncharacterized protein n=1 Tax=Toxocara canis TaxID=6265 RepID=A0A0B2VFA2_TOXCA|nr:hypothetical protein Tcan_04363 [Toxocara canis]